MAIEILSKNKAKFTVSMGSGKAKKRRSKTVTFSKKSELKEMYRQFEDEVLRNPQTDMTVPELVASYIRGRKTLGVKETTLHGYGVAEKRIKSRFERTLAAELTPYMVQDFITDMAQGNGMKKYSPKTISNTISLLSASFDNAARLGQIRTNPCKLVTLPKRDAPDIDIFSQEDMDKFLTALESERLDYKVGYKLALFCGLRRSEILGLREEHINIPFRMLVISETRHDVDGKTVIQTPKTKKSARTLAIPQVVLEDIKALIELHHNFRFEHTDYLVQNGFGQPMTPSAFTSRIYQIERAHGLPLVSLHDLRHTFASMLNKNGVDIARISAELGHSNITTTLNRYTHVFGSATASSRGIADMIDEAFSNADSNRTPEEKKKA